MRVINYLVVLFCFIITISCEEVVEINLNDAKPKYVIEAELNDLSTTQTIKVSETINFSLPERTKPINGATIVVTDPTGRDYRFRSAGDGLYNVTSFRPNRDGDYSLKVTIGEHEFTSKTTRYAYRDIDSLIVRKNLIFGEYHYVITFRFYDPLNEQNNYKYSYSVNGEPYKYFGASTDRFNNGLYVTHEVRERNKLIKFKVGDRVAVQRECIAPDVYQFWNEAQNLFLNPGIAAPANPLTNITNGALGIFSVSSAKIYNVTISDK